MSEDLFFNDTFDNLLFFACENVGVLQNCNGLQCSQKHSPAFDDTLFVINSQVSGASNTVNTDLKVEHVNNDPTFNTVSYVQISHNSLDIKNTLVNNCNENVAHITKPLNVSGRLPDLTSDINLSKEEPIRKNSLRSTKSTSPLTSISSDIDLRLYKDLSVWNLPEEIMLKYSSKKITQMFDWQVECLCSILVSGERKNLIYSAPTSAGKTLVAEILALKTVLERNKKVLFVLPYVSLVQEKINYFQDILSFSTIKVEGFMGSYNPPGGIKSVQIAICTIEKANNALNRMLIEGTLSEIGAVVIDEIHMVGDYNRGYILELMLTKLLYMSRKDSTIDIQIIGMSATLPDLSLLATWLRAELYETDFRPVALYEMCHIENNIYDNKFDVLRTLNKLPDIDTDVDNVLQLCLETVLIGCSVLVFCPTKNWCENLAQQVAVAFWKLGRGGSEMGLKLRDQFKDNKSLTELMDQLINCPVGLDAILGKTVCFGIAFHHAGLTLDERSIIESAFHKGVLRILVATTTLSSGVNLPARRVIIRTPMIYGGRPIDKLTYKQMVGRAGRTGRDEIGESILICRPNERSIAEGLILANNSERDKRGTLSGSCLAGGVNGGRLKRAILEVIASGVVKTKSDLELFFNCTLLSRLQYDEDIDEYTPEEIIKNTMEFLTSKQFIRVIEPSTTTEISINVNNQRAVNINELHEINYVATPLAKACLASSLPPEEGLALLGELDKARQSFVLETDLHIVYSVTPYSVCSQLGDSGVDWLLYLDLWERLSPSMQRVADLVGVQVSYIVAASQGKLMHDTAKNYHKMQVHKRFYTALALQDLVNEMPLSKVATRYNCNKGLLQSLQQSAATFAGMVASFCKQLGWSSMELLIDQFQDRLQFGIGRDLLDLMRLPILTSRLARGLYNAGYETLVSLAISTSAKLMPVLMRMKPYEAASDDINAENLNRLNNMIWFNGCEGMPLDIASNHLIDEARVYLQKEIGLDAGIWGKNPEKQKNKAMVLFSPNNSERTQKSCLSVLSQLIESPDSKINATDHCPDSSKTNSSLDSMKKIGSIEELRNSTSLMALNSDKKVYKQTTFDLGKISYRSFFLQSKGDSILGDSLELSDNSFATEKDIIGSSQSLFNDQINLFENDDICDNLEIKNMSSSFRIDCDESLSQSLSSFELRIDEQKELNLSDDYDDNDQQPFSENDLISDGSAELFVSPQRDDNILNSYRKTEIRSKSSQPIFDSDDEQTINDPKSLIDREYPVELKIVDRGFNNQDIENSEQVESDTVEITRNYLAESKSSTSQNVQHKRHYNNSITSIQSANKLRKLSPAPNFNVDVIMIQERTIFKKFAKDVLNQSVISIAVLCKRAEKKSVIGVPFKKIVIRNEKEGNDYGLFAFKHKHVIGISFSWDVRTCYHLSLEVLSEAENNIIPVNDRFELLSRLFGNDKLTIRGFDCKAMLNMLWHSCRLKVSCQIEDPKIIDWLLHNREQNFYNLIDYYTPTDINLFDLCSTKRTNIVRCETSPTLKFGEIELSILEAVLCFKLSKTAKDIILYKFDGRLAKTFDIEMRVHKILLTAENAGINVDCEKLYKLIGDITDILKTLEDKLYRLAGKRFSYRLSWSRICKMLFETQNIKSMGSLEILNENEISDILINANQMKDVLKKFESPFLKLVFDWRKVGYVLTQVLKPLLKFIHEQKVYGCYSTVSVTGRMFVRNPSLQMMPRDFSIDSLEENSFFVSCRSLFRASAECMFVSADYCQMELRVLAHFCADKLLCEILSSEQDVFKLIASNWFKVSLHKILPKHRADAKQLCYGLIYGMGDKMFAKKLGMSLEEATKLVKEFKNTYPGLKEFIEVCNRDSKNNGYVETLNARKSKKDERHALNTLIQGSASDLTKIAMVLVDDEIRRTFNSTSKTAILSSIESLPLPRLVLQMHDELIYEVHSNDCVRLIEILHKTMPRIFPEAKVPFPVKIKMGTRWGKLTEIDVDLVLG